MDQRDSRFFIRKDKLVHVLGALTALASVAGADRRGHFAWVSTQVLLRATTVQEHLDEWRWIPRFDAEGNINGLSFTGEKAGDDQKLFDAIAPFVEPGSFISMQGEDGSLWRWYFDGANCREQAATVLFDDVHSDIIDVEAREVPGNRALLGR